MKLHHLDNNGKNPFLKKFCLASYIATSEYLPLSTTHHIKNLTDSFDVIKGSSDNSKNNQNPKTNSFEDKLVQLFDRVGRPSFHDFTSGSICIIGHNEDDVETFSDQILFKLGEKSYSKENAKCENISIKLLKNVESRLLIKVSGVVPPRLMNSIIKASSTICVLPLAGIRISCPLAGKISLNPFTKRIIESLGGNLHLRELLIASLAADEFLLIENSPFDRMMHNKGSVRCFQTIIKQHAKSINQIGKS